jgi:hypothetical protein
MNYLTLNYDINCKLHSNIGEDIPEAILQLDIF